MHLHTLLHRLGSRTEHARNGAAKHWGFKDARSIKNKREETSWAMVNTYQFLRDDLDATIEFKFWALYMELV